MSLIDWISRNRQGTALVPGTRGVHSEAAHLLLAGCYAELKGDGLTASMMINAAVGVEAKMRHKEHRQPVDIGTLVTDLQDLVDRVSTELGIGDKQT